MSEWGYIQNISELVIGEKYQVGAIYPPEHLRGEPPYDCVLKEICEFYYKPWDSEKRDRSQTNLRFEDSTNKQTIDVRADEVFSDEFKNYVIYTFKKPKQIENKEPIPTKPKRLPDELVIKFSKHDLKEALTAMGFDVDEYYIDYVGETSCATVVRLTKSIKPVEESAE